MFASSYPTSHERHIHAQRAHRLRAAAIASLFRDIVRWVSASSR